MFARFSVKKPMTILVAVVLVIILGAVSFFKMTPNLLPNMEFPYVIIITSYPGATPETVEETVSKPLEKAMATLDKIKNVASTSSENYSMVTLEFNDDVNMDSIGIDINDKITTVKGQWTDDTIGTPYTMKINPDMMPVTVAAVDVDKENIVDTSSYIKENILPKLEGVEGVASVSTSGIVEQNITVTLSQDKIDAVNSKISDAINKQFADGEQQLSDSKDQIEDGQSQLESGQEQVQSGIDQLEEQQAALGKQLADAKGTLDEKQIELLETKLNLVQQMNNMETQKTSLQSTKSQLESLLTPLNDLQKKEDALKSTVDFLTQTQASLKTLNAQAAEFNAEIQTISENPNLSDSEKAAAIAEIKASDQYVEMENSYNTIDASLAEYGYTRTQVDQKLIETQAALVLTENGLKIIDAALDKMGMSRSQLQENVTQLDNGIAAIDSAVPQLNSALEQLTAGQITVSDAKTQLNEQESAASSQMNNAMTNLLITDNSLESQKTELDSALTQVDSAIDDLQNQKETALASADMSSVITMSMVSGILQAQNFSMPAGYVSQNGEDCMVRVGDKIADIDQLKNLMLFDPKIDGVSPIYLSDVATIENTDNSGEIYAKINSNNGVLLSFTKQSTYATADVSKSISEMFNTLSSENSGIHFTTLMDQGDYINIIVNSVLENLLLGALLAVIILLFFLKDIKPTIIIACSIPLSVMLAIVLMYFSGVTLNIISLSGLAVGVGMLVDNSVVVIENIYRLRNNGVSAIKAAVNGAVQVAGAITASTLTTVCVFVPIVFVTGITKQLFTDMALTIAYSLLASLIVALTLVPAMSQKILRKTTEKKHKWFNKFVGLYERSARFTLRHRFLTILAACILLVASVVISLQRGFIFMPDMDATSISVNVTMPKDNTFDESVKTSDSIISAIREIPEVETVGAMTGDTASVMGGMSSSSSDAGNITMYVLTKDDKSRTNSEIANDIEEKCKDFDCELTASGTSSMTSVSTLTGSGISLTLYGDDLEAMQKTAKDIGTRLEDIDGITEVDNGIGDTTPELKITVDKTKAMSHGLTVAQVYAEISSAIKKQTTATSMTINKESTDVLVVSGSNSKMTADDIKNYKITLDSSSSAMSSGSSSAMSGMSGTSSGTGSTSSLSGLSSSSGSSSSSTKETIRLSDIAKFEETTSMNSIVRSNQKRQITISATVADDQNVTLVNQKAEDAMKNYELPDGFSISFDGESSTIMESMQQLMLMLLLAVAFIYLIMVAQFQSLLSPFIVMFTIPLAFTGGLLGLILTGNEISVISMVGFVMLAGIIVNNGIVLIDYINRLRADGMEKNEAIIAAGKTRMRPILMTALTTILGLSGMALGIGTGAEMMQPIAIVCIGGLIYATIMTLYIVPAAYSLLGRKKIRVVKEEDLEKIDE